MKLTALLVLAGLAVNAQAADSLRLPALLGDHMVVQSGKPVALWGWAGKGQAVSASLAGEEASATTDDQGCWEIQLPPLPAGGPYEMILTAGEERRVIHDVLVGEVWVASGQSNMEFTMDSTADAGKEIPKADLPRVRLFTVERHYAFRPLGDVKGSWRVCTPQTARSFSAVAYHFGKGLNRDLKVPVGLIASDWGGTPAEAWTPRKALDQDRPLRVLARHWEADRAQVQAWKQGLTFDLWLSGVRLVPKNSKDPKILIPFPKADILKGEKTLDRDWAHSETPGSAVILQKMEKGPKEPGGMAHFNGKEFGGGNASLTAVPASGGTTWDLSPYGALEFYTRGRGKFYMALSQPSIRDWDYYATDPFELTPQWTLHHVDLRDLKQGGWGIHRPFTADQVQALAFQALIPYWPKVPSIVYNAMMAPLTRYPIRGVLWYQGESNIERAGQYHRLLSTMIRSWRAAWGEDFPFLIVQLPNYQPLPTETTQGHWAELREAQLRALDVPATGLITTIDLGDADTLHPRDKTDVGERAALCAMGVAYRKPGVYTGPLLESLQAEKGKVVLVFGQTGRGLTVKGGGALKGFELAGADGVFHPAKAQIKANTVLVESQSVTRPVEIRYAWADNPDCDLFNAEGLPASPFRVRIGSKNPKKAS